MAFSLPKRIPTPQDVESARRREHAPVDYYVYLLANRRNGALYVGVTNNLIRRIHEHREGLADGFTKRYGINRLMWFDSTGDVLAAIAREKQLKDWKRAWKIELIERDTRAGGTCTRQFWDRARPPVRPAPQPR